MKPQPSLLAAHLAMGGAALIYGVNYFLLKVFFQEGHSSFAALAARSLIGALFFWLFHTLFIREKLQSRADLGRLALCAFFGITLNQTAFLWGLQQTSQVNAAVLMVLTPVFVFVLALLLRQELWSGLRALGVAVSLGGAVGLILLRAPAVAGNEATVAGDLLIMVNAASYGLFLVLVRPLILRYNTFTITKWIFLLGGIPNIALGALPLLHTDFAGMSAGAWTGLLFLVLVSTIGAYFLNAWSMKRATASMVGAYIYVQPVFVTLFSAFLQKDSLSVGKVLLILLIFAGVYLVSAGARPKAT